MSQYALCLRYYENRVEIFMLNTDGQLNNAYSNYVDLRWRFLALAWNHLTRVFTCYEYIGASRSDTTVTTFCQTTLSGTPRTVTQMQISSNGTESIEGKIAMPRLHLRVVPISEIPYLAREFFN